MDPQTGQQVEMVVTTFMLQFLVSPNRSFARDVSTMPALLYPLSQGDYADVAQAILRADIAGKAPIWAFDKL